MSLTPTTPVQPSTLSARTTARARHALAWCARILWLIRHRLAALDERGGARNSDEALLMAGGVTLGLLILAAGGAFVARQMGVLE